MHAKTHRQLALPIDATTAPSAVVHTQKITEILKRGHEPLAQLDQVLSTRQVVTITGKHRVTIYRWIRAGIFPKKHDAHGHKVGWLRSDIEAWLHKKHRQSAAALPKTNRASYACLSATVFLKNGTTSGTTRGFRGNLRCWKLLF